MNRLLHVSNVADELCCSRKHVYCLIETGELKAINIAVAGRPAYRVPRESVDSFLRNNIVLPG